MSFAIVAGFDKDSDAQIRQLWKTIADADFSKQMLESPWYPHITLAACETLNPVSVGRSLKNLSDSTPAMQTRIESLGIFPTDENVLFLAPVVTYEMLILHAEICEDLADYGASVSAYYQPGHWVPHCTLATHLTTDSMRDAIQLVRKTVLPTSIAIKNVGLIEYSQGNFRIHAQHELK